MDLLTETRIRQAKPTEKACKLFDGDGLFLLVTPQGQKWRRFNTASPPRKSRFRLACTPASGLIPFGIPCGS